MQFVKAIARRASTKPGSDHGSDHGTNRITEKKKKPFKIVFRA